MRTERTDPDRRTARERILSSAFELFAEKGYGATTTRDIAHRAKVNEVTVFRTFGSKETLFREAVKDRLPIRSIGTIVDLDLQLPLEELMVFNAHRVLDVLKQDRHFFMMMVGEIWRHDEVRERIGGEIFEESVGLLGSLFAPLVEKGVIRTMDPIMAARAWIGMVQSYYLFNYLIGPGDVPPETEDLALRGMADVFVNGVRPKEGEGDG